MVSFYCLLQLSMPGEKCACLCTLEETFKFSEKLMN